MQELIKRQIDLWGSLIGLALLSPLFLVVAAMIRIASKGPVFFVQERVGKDGKVFMLFKFRTMVKGAPNKGLGLNVAEDDPRITIVGRVLRNWGLDELPQLINVLKGEMSLVGPRPALKEHVEQYNETQKKRLKVKPGITGWALVLGRNLLTWTEKLKYDVEYVENWSVLWDTKIWLRTPWVVLVAREGLYEEDAGLKDEFNVALTKEES